MNPISSSKHRVWIVAAGLIALVVLWRVGSLGIHPSTDNSKSEASILSATSAGKYQAVLSEIHDAASLQAIVSLATKAGLRIETSTDSDGPSAVISDPASGATLAIAREYDDTFVIPTSTSPRPSVAQSPQVTLGASPTTLSLGTSTLLAWSSTNATTCTASGAWSGSQALKGTLRQTPNSTGTKTYTLTCSGNRGSASSTISVSVNPAPPSSSSKTLKQSLNDLVTSQIAYADSATENPNPLGRDAVCDVAGTDGDVQVHVNADGSIESAGINNYSFDFNCNNFSNHDLCDRNSGAANAAVAAIASLGGPQSEAGNANSIQANISTSQNLPQGNMQGAAVAVSVWQENGTFLEKCTANIAVGASAQMNQQTLTYVYEHEIGHCLGFSHDEKSPDNIMYIGDGPNRWPDDNNVHFNPAQIQYLQDIKAGKPINIDSDTCGAVCDQGEGHVRANIINDPQHECVPQDELCGNKPNTVWDDRTQSCLSCPAGTTADTDTGSCERSTCTWDLNEGGGTICADATGVVCACPTNGAPECQDANGKPVTPPLGICQGHCAEGEVEQPDGSCSTQGHCAEGEVEQPDGSCSTADICAQHPDDPSCQGSSSCAEDPNSQACAEYCVGNPADSSCPANGDNYCAQNPSDPDCESFCSLNPDDASCIGPDPGDEGGASGIGDSNGCGFFDTGGDPLSCLH